jgi:hypothetical protein
LGQGPELRVGQVECHLEPNEALVVFSGNLQEHVDKLGKPIGESDFVEGLIARKTLPAKEMATWLRETLACTSVPPRKQGVSALVVKRSNP